MAKQTRGMNWIQQYAEERAGRDPAFKSACEEEETLLSLVRARKDAELSQQQVADALHVSQPYIAQVERGSKPMSLSLMVRYAHAVGATIEVAVVREHRTR